LVRPGGLLYARHVCGVGIHGPPQATSCGGLPAPVRARQLRDVGFLPDLAVRGTAVSGGDLVGDVAGDPASRVADRAGPGRGVPAGRAGRAEFAVAWATVMAAVVEYCTPLVDDPARMQGVEGLGVDETAFRPMGHLIWSSSC
jgi:hypothetical protein